MKKLHLYFSGQVRTLYTNLPYIVRSIKSSNPEVELHAYYSFWDSTYRELDRANGPRKSPDGVWAIRSEEELESSMISVKKLNSLFLSHGFKTAKGILVDESIMNKLIEESPFKGEENGKKWNETQITSQYYQIKKVLEVESPPTNEYCVRMRADIIINSFPKIDDIGENLVLNYYAFEGCVSNDDVCNEMIWVCKGKYFRDVCSVHDFEKDFVSFKVGERVSWAYFKKLFNEKKIPGVVLYNFDYRVIR